MAVQKCEKCGGEMKKGNKMHSGNSIYIDWQCPKCLNKKLVCEGVSR